MRGPVVRGIIFTAAKAVAIIAFASCAMPLPDMLAMKEPNIVIRKSARTLEVHDGSTLVRKFGIVLGRSPEGDKQIEGDGRTPEGEFYIFTKNAKSRFHLSLGISYPAGEDAERGLAGGLISDEEHRAILAAIGDKAMPPQKTQLGGEIYIHGGGTAEDWTDGCVALANDEMSELFEAIPVGTRVTILE